MVCTNSAAALLVTGWKEHCQANVNSENERCFSAGTTFITFACFCVYEDKLRTNIHAYFSLFHCYWSNCNTRYACQHWSILHNPGLRLGLSYIWLWLLLGNSNIGLRLEKVVDAVNKKTNTNCRPVTGFELKVWHATYATWPLQALSYHIDHTTYCIGTER